eukprot:6200323-Pleurochrysis_carterae.AAC.2
MQRDTQKDSGDLKSHAVTERTGEWESDQVGESAGERGGGSGRGVDEGVKSLRNARGEETFSKREGRQAGGGVERCDQWRRRAMRSVRKRACARVYMRGLCMCACVRVCACMRVCVRVRVLVRVYVRV